MIYSTSHNFVFIHIAKNGGTSITSALGQYGTKGLSRTPLNEILSALPYARPAEKIVHPPHVDARWVRSRIGRDVFDASFSFAVVRNPFDQLVSRYEYIRKSKNHHAHQAAARLEFRDFLRHQKLRDWKFTKTQHSKIADRQGRVLVKKVYRFENFNDVLPDVCSIIGVPPPQKLPHENSTARKPYQLYYDASSREFVENNFREDLDYFGYEFEAKIRSGT